MSTITKVWTFPSSSNPKKTYETLQYADGSISCGCPGWCKRVAEDGSRSCKHTRMVDQGIADSECVSSHDYGSSTTKTKPVKNKAKAIKLDDGFEEPMQRKIQW